MNILHTLGTSLAAVDGNKAEESLGARGASSIEQYARPGGAKLGKIRPTRAKTCLEDQVTPKREASM